MTEVEHESLDALRRTILKRYNAEIYSQSAIEGILDLREAHRLHADAVERIDLDTFDVAYHIIGGGEEGEKRHVETKENADHNLRYLVAVALLDGMVTPAQYRPERIRRNDVQTLLSRVAVRPDAALSQRFPNEMPVRIRLTRRGGDVSEIEKHDYEGFHSRPMPWEQVVRKFERLAIPFAGVELCRAIADVVSRVEEVSVVDLMQLLAKVSSRRST